MEHDESHKIAFVRHSGQTPQDAWFQTSVQFGYLSDDCREFDRPYGTDPLDALEISAMVGPEGNQYGWHLRYYNLHNAELYDLSQRVNLLKGVFAKLSKWEKEWGDPFTFGTYCQRVLKAIGAHAYIRMDQHPEPGGMWEVWRPDSLAYHLDRKLTEAVASAPNRKVEANA
jgi:hypothetical protein